MLQIRDEQLRALEELQWQAFAEELTEHCHHFAPELCRVAGQANLKSTVRLGIKRARHYGFTLRGPLHFYMEMMLSFGSDFDSDPLFPWANQVLSEKTDFSQIGRATKLYEHMSEYIDQVMGPDNRHAIEALRRFVGAQSLDLQSAIHGNLERGLFNLIDYFFPQKRHYAGDRSINLLIQRSRTTGIELGIESDWGIAFLTGLMLVLGHGVTHDLMYPWVGATLNSKSVLDGEDRIERLYRKTRIYAQEVLKNM